MTTLTLTDHEIDELQRFESTTHDAKQLKRIQGLLAVGQGGSPTAVARQLRIGRSTLYEWIDRFREMRSNLDGSTRGLPRSGRPIRQLRCVQERVVELLAKRLAEFGVSPHLLDQTTVSGAVATRGPEDVSRHDGPCTA